MQIYLQDSYAQKILPPLIVKSPYLQTLDLSNNLLTNKFFNVLIISINRALLGKSLNNSLLKFKEILDVILEKKYLLLNSSNYQSVLSDYSRVPILKSHCSRKRGPFLSIGNKPSLQGAQQT